jgi:hypothetical protein
MLETEIRTLLEEAVNTSCKLAIVMVYAPHRHRHLASTPSQMSQRLCRDIWSIEEAMQELAQDGILAHTNEHYQLRPSTTYHEAVARLIAVYDEPLRRQEIFQLVGELDSYAPYRKLLKQSETTFAH